MESKHHEHPPHSLWMEKASIMSIGRTSISYGLWMALRGLRANIMSISRTSRS